MIDRREFIRTGLFRGVSLGAAGVYLAPFLRNLSAADGTKTPARVLFFVQGNGVYPNEIQPKTIARPKKPTRLDDCPLTGHALPESLSPLNPWTERLTMIHGLSGRIARGSHNSGFAALGCWPMGKKAYGETIDAALARNLGGIYPHIGVGVSNKPSAMTYNLTSTERGKALPTLLNPVLAFRQYFAAGAAGTARREFDVDTSLLDFLAEDVKRLRGRLVGSEKDKLDRYLSAFESMGGRQSQLAKMADRIAKAAPSIDPKLGEITESKTGHSGVFDRLDAQFDIASSALIAGLTNVVTVSAGAGPDRIGLSCMASEVGAKGGYVGAHGIGHGGSPHGKSSSEWHALIRHRCLQALARCLTRLASIPEGDGTVLDNTLVVYLSDSAEGHHPRCDEWPILVIGDLGGRLKLGNRYLSYPWYGQKGHRTLANFYLSLLHAVGDRRESFGVPDFGLSDVNQDGPLEEILA
ncbi:MAG: DUF1552 domain-containing protein [Planctomycetota bacterium]